MSWVAWRYPETTTSSTPEVVHWEHSHVTLHHFILFKENIERYIISIDEQNRNNSVVERATELPFSLT